MAKKKSTQKSTQQKAVKKSDVTFRSGMTCSDVSIIAERGVARLKFRCVMDEGKTQIAEIASKYRSELRIDFPSIDGKFNLSIRNGVVNVSNAQKDDVIEVDQSWIVGRACGSLGDGMSWILRDGTLTIEGEGKTPDFMDSKDSPWYIYRSNIKRLEVRGGIQSIGKKSFNKCKNMVEANLGNATVIASRAFAGCVALEIITMDAVQAVNASAFSDCSALKCIRFGSKFKKLDKQSFSGCTVLESVIFNSPSAPAVGESAFAGCPRFVVTSSFTQAELPGIDADFDRKSIASIYVEQVPNTYQCCYDYVDRNMLAVKAADVRGNMVELTGEYSVEPPYIDAESSLTFRISYAGQVSLFKTDLKPRMSGNDGVEWSFDENTGVLSISGTSAMPDYGTIESAPWSMLEDEIKEVVVSGVPNIGKRAFDHCKMLKFVHVENVVEIGDYAFRNCTALDCVELVSVKTVGSFAFQGCSSLISAHLGPDTVKIRKHAFENCAGLSVLRVDCATLPVVEEAALNGVSEGLVVVSKLGEGWADTVSDKKIVYREG